jgi:hypothetical protein
VAIKKDRGVQVNARWICERLISDSDGRISDKQVFFFYLTMKDHWVDRAQHCWFYLLQLFAALFVPMTKERELISLPATFHFVYYLIRPFRLTIKYGRMAIKRWRPSVTGARPVTQGNPNASAKLPL